MAVQRLSRAEKEKNCRQGGHLWRWRRWHMASVWGSLGKVPDGSLKGGRDNGVQDAGRLFRVQSRQFPPEKVEENLGELGCTMLSTQAQKFFPTAQHLLLFTDALGTVLDLSIFVLNWWKIYRAHSFKTKSLSAPSPTGQEQDLSGQKVSRGSLGPPCLLHCHLLCWWSDFIHSSLLYICFKIPNRAVLIRMGQVPLSSPTPRHLRSSSPASPADTFAPLDTYLLLQTGESAEWRLSISIAMIKNIEIRYKVCGISDWEQPLATQYRKVKLLVIWLWLCWTGSHTMQSFLKEMRGRLKAQNADKVF